MNERHLITNRQREILSIVVNAYVETVCPVGSKTIAEFYHKEISSATVRNEMAVLEGVGLITHPHTSAGRVPTDLGYRYFVNSVMHPGAVDSTTAGLVAWEFRQRVKNIEELIERTSRILSSMTEQAGWIFYPDLKALTLKRFDLISYDESHILAVWASVSGLVQTKIVDMDEEIPKAEMARLNYFLNTELGGKSFTEISDYLHDQLTPIKDSLAHLYLSALHIAKRVFDEEEEKHLYLDGSRFVLKQPEFQSTEKAKRLTRTLETKEALLEAFGWPDLQADKICLRIGRENSRHEIWDCTVVTAPYYARDRILGKLGILGPTRMNYERIVSLVDHVSRRLSEAIDGLI